LASWTFDVGRSFFLVPPAQKQLSAYATVTTAYSMATDSPAGGAETFTCGAFS